MDIHHHLHSSKNIYRFGLARMSCLIVRPESIRSSIAVRPLWFLLFFSVAPITKTRWTGLCCRLFESKVKALEEKLTKMEQEQEQKLSELKLVIPLSL